MQNRLRSQIPLTMLRLGLAALFAASLGTLQAETFPLEAESDIVGRLRIAYAAKGDSLPEIGRAADLGYNQIIKANPELNRWIPGEKAQVLLPSEYILPNAPRKGIIVNLAELRLYYFHEGSSKVSTYPVSIGRMDWKTPLGVTKIVRKDKNPPWYPTESIKKEHAEDGDPLPDVFPGGHPDNPLGAYALRLGIPAYLIHGVDQRKALGIGMRVTHGCMRMFPEDIETLFKKVDKGTSVNLINQDIKVGFEEDRLFVQITTPLPEDDDFYEIEFSKARETVKELAGPDIYIDDELLHKAVKAADGLLVEVGRKLDTPVYYNPPPRPVEPPLPMLPPSKKESAK